MTMRCSGRWTKRQNMLMHWKDFAFHGFRCNLQGCNFDRIRATPTVPRTWTRIAHRSIGSVKLVIHPGARHKPSIPFWLGDNVHVRFRHVSDELIRLDSHLVRLVSQYVVTDSPFWHILQSGRLNPVHSHLSFVCIYN